MSKFLSTLFALLVVTLPLHAVTAQVVQGRENCADYNIVQTALRQQYHEVKLVQFLGLNEAGEMVIYEFWGSPFKTSWTVITVDQRHLACSIANGGAWHFMTLGDPT